MEVVEEQGDLGERKYLILFMRNISTAYGVCSRELNPIERTWLNSPQPMHINSLRLPIGTLVSSSENMDISREVLPELGWILPQVQRRGGRPRATKFLVSWETLWSNASSPPPGYIYKM
jgi:hypothetical protein